MSLEYADQLFAFCTFSRGPVYWDCFGNRIGCQGVYHKSHLLCFIFLAVPLFSRTYYIYKENESAKPQTVKEIYTTLYCKNCNTSGRCTSTARWEMDKWSL